VSTRGLWGAAGPARGTGGRVYRASGRGLAGRATGEGLRCRAGPVATAGPSTVPALSGSGGGDGRRRP